MKLKLLSEQPTADLAGEPLAPDDTKTQEKIDKSEQPTPTEPTKLTGQEDTKVQRTIKVIEKLQDAAVGLEAARFTVQQEYSDFSLAKRLEIIKQELIDIIGKTKEHTMRSATKSPAAEKIVSNWLKL